MRAGKLRHQITIQHYVTGSPAQNPTGEPDGAWTDLLTGVSAEWVTLSGRELYAAQEHHSEVKGIWRIRWRSTVTSKMRVVHKGLYYTIHFVPPADRRGVQAQMDLQCSEGVTQS